MKPTKVLNGSEKNTIFRIKSLDTRSSSPSPLTSEVFCRIV